MGEYTKRDIFKANQDWKQDCAKHCKDIIMYGIPELTVGVVSEPIAMTAAQHVHSEYEFMMPMANTVINICDKKIIAVEKQQMIAFNSGYYHGLAVDTVIQGFICILCQKIYLDNIVHSMFGKSTIYFNSECFKIDNELRILLKLFIEEGFGKQTGYNFLMENLANAIIVKIIRAAKSNLSEPPSKDIRCCSDRIKTTVDFLHEQYNLEFSLDQVAKMAGLSPFHFIRVFKAETGNTPYEFFLNVKIEKAKELLANDSMSITEICVECGFNNPSHFSSIFKRKSGFSPSEYRSMLRI